MQDRPSTKADPEPLGDLATARLFARASELDAARKSANMVDDLRAAAVEAGISVSAFDAALAEMQVSEQAPVPEVPASRRRWSFGMGALAATLAVVMLVGALILPRLVLSARDVAVMNDAGMFEEAIVLRCLTPREAATLIRPILGRGSVVIANPPGDASRVLKVRATRPEMEQVKLLLDQHERAGTTACAVRPTGKGTP